MEVIILSVIQEGKRRCLLFASKEDARHFRNFVQFYMEVTKHKMTPNYWLEKGANVQEFMIDQLPCKLGHFSPDAIADMSLDICNAIAAQKGVKFDMQINNLPIMGMREGFVSFKFDKSIFSLVGKECEQIGVK